MPKNTTQCPLPGLEPGPLDPGTGALTMRPPRLIEQTEHQIFSIFEVSLTLTLYFKRIVKVK